MRRTGSTPQPLRDRSGLESALNRGPSAAYYEGANIVRQAALIAVGIAQTQPYLDGNKRTAAMVCIVFLGFNDITIIEEDFDIHEQLIAIAESGVPRAVAEDRFEAWLRLHIRDADMPTTQV